MPASLPAPDHRTYIARLQTHHRALRIALFSSWAVSIVLTIALFFAIYHLRYRDVIYVTTTGIQPEGFVSQYTAQEFARNFIHWLTTWSHESLPERNTYLIPLICTETQNSYQLILEAEAKQAAVGRVSQQGRIDFIRHIESTADSFLFNYRITRTSHFLNVTSTFNELYSLTIHHTPAPDGTRRLCVASHRRIG